MEDEENGRFGINNQGVEGVILVNIKARQVLESMVFSMGYGTKIADKFCEISVPVLSGNFFPSRGV